MVEAREVMLETAEGDSAERLWKLQREPGDPTTAHLSHPSARHLMALGVLRGGVNV